MATPPNYRTVRFVDSAKSLIFDFASEIVLGIRVPASFGQSSITFEETRDSTSFNAVADATNAAIAITVDGSTAKTYDLTSVFPACIGKGRLSVSGAITQDVEIITKGI